MDKLLIYLNALSSDDQTAFAARCDTTVGYLRKACSKGQRLGEGLCIKIERESGGEVRCEAIRPDVDWAYLRNSLHAEPSLPADAGVPQKIQPNQAPALTPTAQAAITVIADGAQAQSTAPAQDAPADAPSGSASHMASLEA